MKTGKTLYVPDRKKWRAWLVRHAATAPEIWLLYPRKHSRKKRIPYNDAVEEALCFGWIDSLLHAVDEDTYAQRFSPRRKGSPWSPMNKERLRRLMEAGRVTEAGLAQAPAEFRRSTRVPRWTLPADIRRALQADSAVWRNYRRFPASYKRIRIGWIEGARKRPEVFRQRLRYFLKMTSQNKMFGMVR